MKEQILQNHRNYTIISVHVSHTACFLKTSNTQCEPHELTAGIEYLPHTLDGFIDHHDQNCFPLHMHRTFWFQTAYTIPKSTFALVDPSTDVLETPLQASHTD
jgi:hypothetical protein